MLALKQSDSTEPNMNKIENIKSRKGKYNKYFKVYTYYQSRGGEKSLLDVITYSIQRETVSSYDSGSSNLKWEAQNGYLMSLSGTPATEVQLVDLK